jgi:hypothetical protein
MPALRKRPPRDRADEPTRQALWQAANAKARWAHIALASGLRRGLVERQPCEVCGAEPTDGHHDDYDAPLRVKWLCRKHHRALHLQGSQAK